MNLKMRFVIPSVLAVSLAAVIGGFFLSEPRTSLAAPDQPAFPIYTPGNFTFSAPLELTGHPPSPAFFQQDAEPEIAVDLHGTIYVTAIQGVPGGTDLWKSTDKGASFAYLGQPDGAQDHCSPPTVQCAAAGGGDDQIDVSAGGYLYVSSLWLGNITMSTSYDGGIGGAVAGQKWEVDPAAAQVVSDDRQWVAAYGPQTINMTYAATAPTRPPGGFGLFFVKSTDGGKTYGPPVEITAATALDTVNVEGNLVVDPYNGNLYTTYIPLNQNNVIRLASSTDGGMTWNVTTAYTGPGGTTTRGVFPIIGVDRGGNVHLVFTQSADTATHANCHVFLTSTASPAAANPTWTSAIQLDNNGTNTGSACQAWVVSGSPGVVDVTWLGSSGTSPTTAPFDWHVYFGQVTNALSGSPTISANQAESAQIHDNVICFNGGACSGSGSTGTRQLLEYYRMVLDPEGNANIAYADSFNNCPSSTCITNTWFTKQTGGASAYNPPAPPPPATFAANLSVPGSLGTAEPNAWVDSHNCIFGGAIGGPVDFISKDSGMSFTPHTVVVGSGLHGGDFDIKSMPNANGSRPDQIYTADLGITTVHIGKSTDGGNTYVQPGTGGAAGEVSVSSDRMWLYSDRGVPTATDQTVYLMDHEFTSEEIRFAALTNDMAWSPFAAGTTAAELIVPPNNTLPNTNPGPVFVDKNSHTVFGIFAASTLTTNSMAPPFGKEPNVWEAAGAAPAAAGLPPGPFTNYPVFKGLFDSPAAAPSPAPSIPPSAATIGSHVANIFPSGAVDSAGNVYVTWSMNSTRYNTQGSSGPSTTFDVWLACSHDGGKNFYGPWKVSSGFGTAIFPWVAGGDAGRIDISWYQSASVAPPLVADISNPGALTGGPNNMPAGSNWNVMFAQSLNANTREPVFTVSQASDHIIHTGSISNGGTFGSSDRSLLDFFNVAIGPDGLANVFNADNGISSLHINYIRQIGGSFALTNPSTVTCLPIPPLTGVQSVKTHPGAGQFGIDMPLVGTRGVECRGTGSTNNYTLVFTFANPLTSIAGATVTAHNPTNGTGSVSTTLLGPGANQCTVNLTGVSTGQYITVTLNNVMDMSGNVGNVVGPQVGILVGDVNASGTVTSGDTNLCKQQALQTVTSSNFRDDINFTGAITTGDVNLIKQQALTQLPTPP